MKETLIFILGLLLLTVALEVIAKIRSKMGLRRLQKLEAVECLPPEFHTVQTVEVRPATIKVFPVRNGKVVGEFVARRRLDGSFGRNLMVWGKEGNKLPPKSITFEPIEALSLVNCFEKSQREIEGFINEQFVKRFKRKEAKAEPSVPGKMSTPVQQVIAEVPAASPAPEPMNVAQPRVRNFKGSYEGIFIKAGIQKHVRTEKDKVEEYKSFTVTLDTSQGQRLVTGNDLKRALDEAEVEQGNLIKVFHTGNEDVPGGHKKKIFQIINLSKKQVEQLNGNLFPERKETCQ